MTIEWQNVRKVLIVRLRSIGDTVLTTPSLISLREFLPEVQIDVLLEDWVAPLFEGFDAIDNVLSVSKATRNRVGLARRIRKEKYDVAFNLHGGTTATFFVRASGARHRVGYSNYSYSFLYNHRLTSASDFWKKDQTHSAEQQMALLGFVGIPVSERRKSRLNVSEESRRGCVAKICEELRAKGVTEPDQGTLPDNLALIHPVAAFDTKQWEATNFAKIADFLHGEGLQPVAVATKNERNVLNELAKAIKAARFDVG